MAVFDIPLSFAPALELEERTSFRHRAVTFGDGYEQRSGAGINPKIRMVTPRFVALSTDRKNELVGILDDVGAVHLIRWAVPGDTVFSQWWLDGPYTIKRIGIKHWEVSFSLRLFITTAEPVPTVVPNL
jgi:phage-related protein